MKAYLEYNMRQYRRKTIPQLIRELDTLHRRLIAARLGV